MPGIKKPIWMKLAKRLFKFIDRQKYKYAHCWLGERSAIIRVWKAKMVTENGETYQAEDGILATISVENEIIWCSAVGEPLWHVDLKHPLSIEFTIWWMCKIGIARVAFEKAEDAEIGERPTAVQISTIKRQFDASATPTIR